MVLETHVPDAELESYMTPDLESFTRLARAHPKMEFNSLMGMVFRPEGLLDSFRRLAGNKAAGVDGMKKVDYAVGLEDRIAALSARLRRLGYRPQPVRRVYIPKAHGGRRPLGIPAFEDRIVQDRLSQILQAIWEPEFCDCSFGFRPGRSAHDALRRVDEIIMQHRTSYVVEADIKGFFSHVDHGWMQRFLQHRITDRRLVRILQRFLRGDVMEDGVVQASEEGTPQGGLVSPVLSNVYLHYVLDLWFERWLVKRCRGRAFFVRYGDDFVALFEREEDARWFLEELPKRLAKFRLEIEPSKTQLLPFGVARGRSKASSVSSPRTFNFLGFTHYIGRSRRGQPVLSRQTERERMKRKLKEVKQRLKVLRIHGTNAMVDYVVRHLRGHLQYYGVSGNSRAMGRYWWWMRRLLFKWLNRRSQKRSLTWEEFLRLLAARKLPKPHLVHRLYGVAFRPT